MAKKEYIATETTQKEIKELVAALRDTLAPESGGGSGLGVAPHVTVTAPTGCTVTATNGSTVLTASEEGTTGVYQFTLPHLGTWVLAVTKDSHTGTRTLVVETVKEYAVKMSYGYRYGYRIKKSESGPAARVEYLYDAVGMTPAAMNFTTGVFDYGDWGDKWFVTDNKPLMLKNDGTVDYYLNPNNYAEKEDGTASDVAYESYGGNAMAQFPLCWVKRYEDDDYEYEIVSDVQYDEDYKAYAHTCADGTITDYFYWSIYGGSGSSDKIRSLSGKTLSQSLTAAQEIAGATANGSGWYTHTWSQRELIRTLCVLMGKSTDTQSVFGNGNCRSATSNSGLLTTGTLDSMGQFYGYNDNTHQVKVFHIEKFWGDQWDRTAGLINDNGKIYVKITPEGDGYRVTDVVGYTNTGITISGTSGGYISAATCTEYGIIPTTISGSGSTYYCDGSWFNNGQLDYLFAGASASDAPARGGAFAFDVSNAPSGTSWIRGCGLSWQSPGAA